MQIIPSKSDAHRALICAALSEKPCRVICETTSKDIEATKKCLAALKQGEEAMYCGESGSTLRFLLPVMGAKGHKAAFYPEGRLPQRPLSPLYEELTAHGCRLSPQGSVPLTIEGQLQAGVYTLPGNVSSQYISGLLFALPMLEGDSELHIQGFMESAPYVDMTATTLTQFGIRIEKTEYGYHIPGGQTYRAPDAYEVEGDWSNACFFLTAGALTEGGIQVTGLNPDSLQGDRAVLELLSRFGAQVHQTAEGITVTPGRTLKPIRIDVSQIPDMTPALAALALAVPGKTEITGAGRLRIKESDRLAAITETVTALGGNIEELADGLIIHGGTPLCGGVADSHNDHRIAMMAAIISLLCEDKVIIYGADAVKKSYPTFFETMKEAGLDYNIERK